MKFYRLLFGIVFLLISLSVSAQKIQAGLGIDKLKIGLKSKKVQKTLGVPSEVRSTVAERMSLMGENIEVDKQLPFLLGFDEVWIYDENSLKQGALPVSRIYIKGNKVVYIELSVKSEGKYAPSKWQNAQTEQAIHFQDEASEIEKKYGNSYLNTVEKDDDLYIFLDNGIAFSTNEADLIYKIHLFKALEFAKRDDVAKALTK